MKLKIVSLGNIFVYILFSLFLCIPFNMSCKKSKTVDENNSTQVVNESINKKETMSCIDIKDHPELSKEDQFFYNYSSQTGNDEYILKNNCYSFYTEYWKKELKGYENLDKSDRRYNNFDKIKKIIINPEIDTEIKSIQGNIAIISRSAFGLDLEDDLRKLEDIWVYRSDKWELLRGYENNTGRKIQLLNLNDDEYIDAIVSGGCCDSSELHVFIGNKDNVLILRQIIIITGIGGLEYNDKCDSKFDVKPYDAMVERYNSKPKLVKFDCSINGYVFTENK